MEEKEKQSMEQEDKGEKEKDKHTIERDEETVNKTDEVPEIEILEADAKETEQTESNDIELEKLKSKVEQLEQEKNNHYERMLRVQAEFDNFKKRTQKENEAAAKYKSQDLGEALLPALDNFDRALQADVPEAAESFVEGMTMVYRQLKDALKTQGIEEMETAGKPFNPNLHHAVMQVESDEAESNTITEELQKGYMLKDRVIRPAMVKVNK